MLYDKIEDLIGNTPLLKIDGAKYGLADADIYMKLEYLNPFGSVKDRTALGLTSGVREKLGPGYGLIESSSGNTAKALALIASQRGAKLTSVTNRVKVPEVDMMMRYLGIEIIALPGRSECPNPNDDDNPLNIIYQMERENPDKYFHTSQYESKLNPKAHEETTAKEIYDVLGEVDAYVSGVGTGGSSGGVIDYAKKNGKVTDFIGVMSEVSDFLPGIRSRNELFETALFNESMFDDLIRVDTMDALEYLRMLVLNEGVLAGPTTGANFAAAIRYAKSTKQPKSNTRRKIVCIACDRLESYMIYIAKRQPELFSKNDFTDLYRSHVTDEDKLLVEKQANLDTVDWIAKNNVKVIDTRSVKAYSQFRIKYSVSYPETYLLDAVSAGTPFNSDDEVLLVCPTGDRSLHLAATLRKRGIKAFSLAGGLVAWRKNGLEFERK